MYECGDDEIEAIRRVIEKKKLFRFQGKDVPTESSLFESEFAAAMESKYGLILTSGTNALILALEAADIGPGDEVLIPSFTFFATAAAVTQVGAIPIIANIDENLGISVSECRELITERTRAIIPVHMDGLNCNMDGVLELAKEYSLTVIEDVAQAVGGSYRGRRLGSLGDFGCYSFNEDKIISCGEGGGLVTSSRQNYEKAFFMHDTCAQFGATMKDQRQSVEAFVGRSMRVSEISSAMMRVQLEKLDKIIHKLRQNKNIFVKSLKDSGVNIVESCDPEGDCGTSVHLVFSDPIEAITKGRSLMKAGIVNYPISIRPAHAVWQWAHLFEKQAFLDARKNPFAQAKTQFDYSRKNFLPTLELLNRVIKLPIPYELGEEDCEKQVAQVLSLITD